VSQRGQHAHQIERIAVAGVNRKRLVAAFFRLGELTRFEMTGGEFEKGGWCPPRAGETSGFAGGGPPLSTIH
jgi:hypothetical protein